MRALSTQILADILSTSKKVIDGKIKRGEIKKCNDSGLVPLAEVEHFPEVKALLNSSWQDELKVKPNREYNMIELFAGAGGLALGMEQAGFKSVLLNEWDKHACATLRHNRPNWNVIEGDISEVNFTPYHNQIDLLTGGFPCQAFSYAGKSLGFEDVRGTLFFEMARAIKESQPKVFLAENVRALLTHDNGRTISTINNIITELGYEVIDQNIVKAIFYKVPQKRERLIIIAVRKDLVANAKYQRPSPYHRILTLRDALLKGELYGCDVPASEGQKYPKRKQEIMAMIPEGGYWKDLDLEVQKEYMKASFHLGGGKTGMARRLSMNEPSLTLTCAPAQKQTERCHPLETRPLAVREYARIQTFPDDWEFKGSLSAQYKQIGNAVPVNMAAAIGRSIVKLLNEIEEPTNT